MTQRLSRERERALGFVTGVAPPFGSGMTVLGSPVKRNELFFTAVLRLMPVARFAVVQTASLSVAEPLACQRASASNACSGRVTWGFICPFS